MAVPAMSDQFDCIPVMPRDYSTHKRKREEDQEPIKHDNQDNSIPSQQQQPTESNQHSTANAVVDSTPATATSASNKPAKKAKTVKISAIHPDRLRKRPKLENKPEKVSHTRRKLDKLKKKVKLTKEAKKKAAEEATQQAQLEAEQKATGKQLVTASIPKAISLQEDPSTQQAAITKLTLEEQAKRVIELFAAYKRSIGQPLSELEVEEFAFKVDAMRPLYRHSMSQLSRSIQTLFGAKIAQLTAAVPVPATASDSAVSVPAAASAPVDSSCCGAPLILILTHSTERCLAMIHHIKTLKLQTPVCKLFARHMKVSKQIETLSLPNCLLCVGTPSRVKTLSDLGHLKWSRLQHLILDCEESIKKFDIFTLHETKADLMSILEQHALPQLRKKGGCKLSLL